MTLRPQGATPWLHEWPMIKARWDGGYWGITSDMTSTWPKFKGWILINMVIFFLRKGTSKRENPSGSEIFKIFLN